MDKMRNNKFCKIMQSTNAGLNRFILAQNASYTYVLPQSHSPKGLATSKSMGDKGSVLTCDHNPHAFE